MSDKDAVKPFALLGIDIGTTHCKAGLFIQEEAVLRAAGLASRTSNARREPNGYSYYDPAELWEIAKGVIEEVVAAAGDVPIAAVGIASMAESGLLVDNATGQPVSAIQPWFDATAFRQADHLAPLGNPSLRLERFSKSGIYPTFKCSLAKILWLREQEKKSLEGTTWLLAADYIAFLLTGSKGTDYSLAGRTFAFDIEKMAWDETWLKRFDLTPDLFPPARLSGTPVGKVLPGVISGLAEGTPVSVAGHDHVCAAYALGASKPGRVFDSMGTAETLMGALTDRALGEAEYGSGLSYGRNVVEKRLYWMGGLSSSGGSIEWMRAILGCPQLSYAEMQAMLETADPEPTGIVYLPYLAGSGSPHTDTSARAAFVGLDAPHTGADLLKAVLEGTAFELELIRRGARSISGDAVNRVVAAGGGTRNRTWMQIKADVFGVPIDVPEMTEATLLGAALRAAVGSGLYATDDEAMAARPEIPIKTYKPDPLRHARYQGIYENGFMALQEPVRRYSRWLSHSV